MADDYQAAIERSAAHPLPEARLPAHLRPDVLRHARQLLESVGASLPRDLHFAPRFPTSGTASRE
jgi:hypothetical protein